MSPAGLGFSNQGPRGLLQSTLRLMMDQGSCKCSCEITQCAQSLDQAFSCFTSAAPVSQAKPQVHHHAIDQVSAKVPAVRSTRLDMQFNAESLRSIAASISDKAPGLDSWQAGCLYKMPLTWWAMAAELWSHVWSNAAVPKPWKYAEVTLIRKNGGPSTLGPSL